MEEGKIEEKNGGVEGGAGFGACTINLLKSIMGAGMLSLPSAFKAAGALPGLLLLAVAAVLSGSGLLLLVMASHRVTSLGLAPNRTSSFAALAGPTYPKAAILFEGAVFFKCFLVAVSYLKVVGGTIPEVVKGMNASTGALLTSNLFWVSSTVLLITPVCFLHRMESLKYTSFLGLLGILYLFILSIVLFFGYNDSVGESFSNIRPFVPFSMETLSCFSIFVFALTCHQNIFPIYNEMKDNRPRPLSRLIIICMTLSFVIYSIFALAFYGVFGKGVETLVLSNLPSKGAAYIAARLLYAMLMVFSYPILAFPSRSSLIKIINMVIPESPKTQFLLHISVTVGILVGSWLLAVLPISLKFLLTLVGCTAGTVICYFLPAMFWWKLEEGKPLRGGKIAALVLFIFGILATVIPLTSLIISTVFTSLSS